MPEIINAEHVGVDVAVVGANVVLTTELTVIQHGADDSVTRPSVACVYWMGSVDPTNRAVGDFWLETSAFD
jgi:hypothetical protein